uniref:WAT1-related protein n=1 Tax=Nelumbo nucifera TaxID=4432 RepID=A0A822YF17_NELNU|nr:TPA_asm: hypothetical protein HUJ06_009863 [Nelumbo nucifera]
MKQTKGNMRSRSRRLWDAIPFAGMMMVECSSVGLITLSKASMLRGMSNFIFVMYSYALATLLLLPSAFFCRRATLPPITVSLLCRLFLLGLIGYLVQVFAYTGINYSSPTLASAMSNLIPAFTFILAIIFRFFSVLKVLLYMVISIIRQMKELGVGNSWHTFFLEKRLAAFCTSRPNEAEL